MFGRISPAGESVSCLPRRLVGAYPSRLVGKKTEVQRRQVEELVISNSQESIQKRINQKEEKYIGKFDKKEAEWWLLISDPEDEMNTFDLRFNLNDLEFKSDFFKTVFFLSKYLYKCKFYELRIERYG